MVESLQADLGSASHVGGQIWNSAWTSSTRIWRHGKSPGRFSEKRSAARGRKGVGEYEARVRLPICGCRGVGLSALIVLRIDSVLASEETHVGHGERLEATQKLVQDLVVVLLLSAARVRSRQSLVRLLAAPVRGRNSPPFLVQQIFEPLEQADVAPLFNELVDPSAQVQEKISISIR